MGSCPYCGNTFNVRAEPLGRSLCPLCLQILSEKYVRAPFVTQLAKEFHVGTDAIKQWALGHARQPRLICVNCGREFVTVNPGGRCPLCLLARRTVS